jgi:GntR family transcriptional regulator
MVRRVPLDLNDRSVSRWEDRPLHRQLADAIRAQIRTGQLKPGETLPAEADIAKSTGLSRTAVRDALDVLTGEGLIIKRAGAMSRVAAPPPVRHMSTSRYQRELEILRKLDGGEHPLTSAFVQDHGVDWEDHRIEVISYAEDAATEEDARRLDIAPGSAVLRRQLIKYVADQPVQLQESTLPLHLVVDTPVADPARQPWPGGTLAELFSVDLIATKVVEEATARTPSTAERRQLEMEAAGPVLIIVRTFFADVEGAEQPVETSVVTVPAARMILRYETDLRA